ncbi:Uncharacterised protein [Lysinibacillus sphaericus]|nr:Uncharacterised protein [Lysinibacillus sphaericus]
MTAVIGSVGRRIGTMKSGIGITKRRIGNMGKLIGNETQFNQSKGLIGSATLNSNCKMHAEKRIGKMIAVIGSFGRRIGTMTSGIGITKRRIGNMGKFIGNETQFNQFKGLIGSATLDFNDKCMLKRESAK